jgi:quinol monooxygenase YgiN
MICLAVTYVVKPGTEDEAVEHFRRLIPASRAEPGCLQYVVHRVRDEPRTFFIYEQYRDDAAFAAHQASPYFQEHVVAGVRPLAESRAAKVCEPLEP